MLEEARISYRTPNYLFERRKKKAFTSASMTRKSDRLSQLHLKCLTCEKDISKNDKYLPCRLCTKHFHATCYDIPDTVYEYLTEETTSKNNVRFICNFCTSLEESNTEEAPKAFESKLDDLTSQISDLSKQMKVLAENQTKLDQKSSPIVMASENIPPAKNKWPSLASIGSNDSDELNIITTLAKKLLNDEKTLSEDRKERENNIIMFNVTENETHKTDDTIFSQQLCKDTMEIESIPEVKMNRIGEKHGNRDRPLKVTFTSTWDKRKFLARMFKTKSVEKYDNLRVAHDMSKEDREENKRLLKLAYEQNINEKPSDFRYKVRGPPWRMRVVKVFQKN